MLRTNRSFLILLLVCVLVRAALWFIYEPITFPDTSSYESLAKQIQGLDFSGYLGLRTPVYPLLLLVGGLNHWMVWLIQSVLGIAISIVLFKIALDQTGSGSWSLLIGLSYSLSINQVFFEASILTETLSTFFIVLSLLFAAQRSYATKRGSFYQISNAVVVSLAGLTRPFLLFLIPLYFLFLVSQRIAERTSPYQSLKSLSGFVIPTAIIVFGWCSFNKFTIDYFGPTTLTGLHLVNHGEAILDLAPEEEYADIEDVYTKFKQKQNVAVATPSLTIWDAWSLMQEETGLTFSEFSSKLTRMSIELFIEHPVLYLKGVSRAWVGFWKETNYWKLDKVKSVNIRQLLEGTWWIQRHLLVGIELLFLCIALREMYSVLIRRRIDSQFNLLIISIVVSASLFQALVELENARYAIPFQPLILYIVLIWTWHRYHDFAQGLRLYVGYIAEKL